MISSFGTCTWHPGHGLDLICLKDRDKFPLLTPAVFQCIGVAQGWLKIQYGAHIYCVKPEVFKPIPTPKFFLGQDVFVPTKREIGKISALTWHFKELHHIYSISFNGKASARRYVESELSHLV